MFVEILILIKIIMLFVIAPDSMRHKDPKGGRSSRRRR